MSENPLPPPIDLSQLSKAKRRNKSRNQNTSRRDFLKSGAVAGAAVAAPYMITSNALGQNGVPPASERIVMGGIGIGNMGRGDQGAFLGRNDVQYVAVSDVRTNAREDAKKKVDGKYSNSDCQAYQMVIKQGAKFALADDAELGIVECLTALGKSDEAQTRNAALLKKYNRKIGQTAIVRLAQRATASQ